VLLALIFPLVLYTTFRSTQKTAGWRTFYVPIPALGRVKGPPTLHIDDALDGAYSKPTQTLFSSLLVVCNRRRHAKFTGGSPHLLRQSCLHTIMCTIMNPMHGSIDISSIVCTRVLPSYPADSSLTASTAACLG